MRLPQSALARGADPPLSLSFPQVTRLEWATGWHSVLSNTPLDNWSRQPGLCYRSSMNFPDLGKFPVAKGSSPPSDTTHYPIFSCLTCEYLRADRDIGRILSCPGW